jgi:hypothetical protein
MLEALLITEISFSFYSDCSLETTSEELVAHRMTGLGRIIRLTGPFHSVRSKYGQTR